MKGNGFSDEPELKPPKDSTLLIVTVLIGLCMLVFIGMLGASFGWW